MGSQRRVCGPRGCGRVSPRGAVCQMNGRRLRRAGVRFCVGVLWFVGALAVLVGVHGLFGPGWAPEALAPQAGADPIAESETGCRYGRERYTIWHPSDHSRPAETNRAWTRYRCKPAPTTTTAPPPPDNCAPYGAWPSGKCRACPVGQHTHGSGCHSVNDDHSTATTTTTTTTAPSTTTTRPASCSAGKHNHAYSPGWCHSDDHLTRPACHATQRLRYRTHRPDSTHQWVYVEPCPPPTTTTSVPPEGSGTQSGCSASLDPQTTKMVQGTLAAGCTSQRRSTQTSLTYYARRYTLTLSSPVWLTIDLESASGQGKLSNPYLLLLAGHGAAGEVLEQNDDSGSGSNSSNSRLSEVFLPSGKYTIEATSHSSGATGNYVLRVKTQSPDQVADSVIVTGLTESSWVSAGNEEEEVELLFSFAYTPDPDDPDARSVELSPQVQSIKPKAAGLSVSLDHSAGSGTVTIDPKKATAGDYRVVLKFIKDGSTTVLGRYGFEVKVCPQGQVVPAGGTGCAPDATGVPRITRSPHGNVPSTCIERVPAQRWYVAVRQWPASSTKCYVLDGTGNRPARYFVFEVPFSSAEVTLQLTSQQDVYMMLSKRVTAASGVTPGVDLGTLQHQDDNGYRTYGDLSSTDSWITTTLSRGVYVVVATIAERGSTNTQAVSGEFTLTIKVPYPAGSCPALNSAAAASSSAHRTGGPIVSAMPARTGGLGQCP